jgi:hypothetical protein
VAPADDEQPHGKTATRSPQVTVCAGKSAPTVPGSRWAILKVRLLTGHLVANGDGLSVQSRLPAELAMITTWCTGVIAFSRMASQADSC